MRFKKMLSFFMAMIMTLTLMPANVFAAESSSSPTLTKTAEWVDQETGLAKITMTAKGTPVEVIAKNGADVLLVLDASGSMKTHPETTCRGDLELKGWLHRYYKCSECQTTYDYYAAPTNLKCTQKVSMGESRWEIAQDAAEELVDQVIPDAQTDNRMGVILFSADGKSSASNNNFGNHNKAIKKSQSFTKDKDDVMDACSFSPSGGTDYTGALQKAYDMIDSRTDKNRPVYLVFLSDGAPGGYTISGREYNRIGNSNWDGSNEISLLKSTSDESDVTIYTVGFGLTDSDAIDLLDGYASDSSRSYNITDGNELAGLFTEIGNTIASGVSVWDTIDTNYFTLTNKPGTNKSYFVSDGTVQCSNNSQFVWNMDNFSQSGETLEIYIQIKAEYLNKNGDYPTNKINSAYGEYVGTDGNKVDLDVSETGASSPVPTLNAKAKNVKVEFHFVGDNKNKVSFNDPSQAIQLVPIGGNVLKPSVTVVDGYKITDWFTTGDCTGTAFNFNNPISQNHAINLFARVDEDANAKYAYTVEFYKNEIKAETLSGSVWAGDPVVTVASATALKEQNYANYTFDEVKVGQTKYTKDTDKIAINKNGDTVIQAYYTSGTVDLTFHIGEYGKFSAPADKDKVSVKRIAQYDTNFNDVPGVTAQLGWQPVGWYEEGNEDTIINFPQTVTGAKTYIMKYVKNDADWKTVTFLKNDGTSVQHKVIDEILVGSNISANAWPMNPDRSGYAFKGWYTMDGTNGNWGDPFSQSTIVNENMNVYAKWEKIKTDVTIEYYLGSVDGRKLTFSEQQKVSNATIGASFTEYITDALKEKGSTATNLNVDKFYYKISNESAIVYINGDKLGTQTVKDGDTIKVVYPGKTGTFKVWEYFLTNDANQNYGQYLKQHESTLAHGSDLKYGASETDLTIAEINKILGDSLKATKEKYPGAKLKSVYFDYQKVGEDGKATWQTPITATLSSDGTVVEAFNGLAGIKIHGDCETRLTFSYELPVYNVKYFVFEKKDSTDTTITAKFNTTQEALAAVAKHISHNSAQYSNALFEGKSKISSVDLAKFAISVTPDTKDRTETDDAKFADLIRDYKGTGALNAEYKKAPGYDVVPFRLVQEGNTVHVDCYLVKNQDAWTSIKFNVGSHGKWDDGTTEVISIDAVKGAKWSDYASLIPEKPVPSDIGWKLASDTQIWDQAVPADTGTIPDEGITFTALWVEDKADVTFVLKGITTNGTEELFGAVKPETQSIQKGKSAVDPTDTTTANIQKGYSFVGWFTDMECTIPFDFSNVVTEAKTLYGKVIVNEEAWARVTFKADSNGKLNDGADDVETIVTDPILLGNKIGRSIPTAKANAGFEFDAWYKVTETEEGMTEIKETPSAETVVDSNLKYLAKFAQLLKVTFHVNTSKAAEGTQSIYEKKDISRNTKWAAIEVPSVLGKLRENVYSHDYKFVGWGVESFPDTITQNLSYTAEFDDIYTFVVEHAELNGKKPEFLDGEHPKPYKKEAGNEISSQAKITPRGYELTNITVYVGEEKQEVATTAELMQKLKELYNLTLTEDGTLSGAMPEDCIWIKYGYEEMAKHTVAYVSDGVVTGMPENITDRYEGDEITLSTVEPKRDGYNFGGWEVIQEVVTINEGKFIMPNSDVTLKAMWTPNEEVWNYTVVHYLEGADKPFSTTTGSVLKREPNINSIVLNAPQGYKFKEYQVNGDTTNLPVSIMDDDSVIGVIYETNDLIVKHVYGDTTVYDTNQSKADVEDGKVTVNAVNSGRYTRLRSVTVNGNNVSASRSIVVDFTDDNKYQVVFVYGRRSTDTDEPTTPGGNNGGGSDFGEEVTILEEEVPLADGLNMVDHFAYIFGYEDDTVRPMNRISREEVAAIFYRLLNDAVRESFKTTKHNFPDVLGQRWSNTSIATLTNGEILAGYPNGQFKPGNAITRAEFAVIVSKFDSLSKSEKNMFKDIENHWAKDFINSAALKGWINGYPDGAFHPDEYITRAEAMTLINSVLNRRVSKEGMLEDAKYWTDNQEDAWYYEAVMEATNSHDYTRETADGVETWTAMKPDRTWD
ncbi:InlB B-repeat-containing protein [Anaerotignum sp.]|uniref:InlB B-repeat-containing protein n=1 Tax=Anaerotignum sp. TaxID=2039241 RepID=UPI00332FBA15